MTKRPIVVHRGVPLLALGAILASILTVVGNGRGEAATLPGGFVEEVVASSSLSSITAFDFLPDGRLLVTEKRGRIKIVDPANPTSSTTVLNIQTIVNTAADRGLIGLAVDPDFATTERVFIAYTYDPPEVLDPTPYWDGNTTTNRTLGNGSENGSGQRVSRITSYQLDAADDYESVVAGSEIILVGTNSTWDNIGDPFAYQTNYDVEWACMTYVGGELPQDGTPIDDCLPSEGVSHAIDGLLFGPDGYLYASMGDGAAWNDVDRKALRALDPDILAGKIIRIDPATGDAVPTNPFYSGDGSDNASFVWASGLRNPFRFTFDDATGAMYIGDVGWKNYEELNLGVAGASYGWPCFEGGLTPAQIAADISEGPGSNIAQSSYSSLPECAAYPAATQTPPARAWCHYHINPGICQPANTSLSSLAGVVYPGGTYPSAYEGLWYGDIVAGWMKVLDLTTGTTLDITDDFSIPVDMKIGPDGDVYYASRGASEVIAIRFDGGNNQQPTALATADQTVGPSPLAVAFDGSGSSDPDGTILSYDWDFGDGASDSGAMVSHNYTVNGTYTAELTVTDNSGGTDTDEIIIQVGNTAPVPSITFPADGVVLPIGSVVQLQGSATDAEDGPIPDPQLSWTGIFHHNDHIHEDAYQGQGSLPVPLNLEDHADDTYIEICLTATDSEGLEGTTCIDILPTEVEYTFETSPAGLDVIYNGQQFTTPYTVIVPSGVNRSIDVPEPQGNLGFDQWSLGGPKNQVIVTDFTDQTVTATMSVLPQPTITAGSVAIDPEGDAGSTTWNVPVTLSNPFGSEVTVDWATVDWPSTPGLAESGSDYVAASGTLTFAPGETTKNVPIEVLGDTVHEPPLIGGEWGLVELSNPTNATIDLGGFFGLGVFIIVDDDPEPIITAGSVVVDPEGDAGSTTWNLPVTLSNASASEVTVDWATVDWPSAPGLAESGSDYVAASGTLTFAPGETTKNVPIDVLGDTLHEPALLGGEWGLVELSNPANGTIDTGGFFGLGVFAIADDDPEPVIAAGTVEVDPEGDAGSTIWNLPVTLSNPSASEVTVDWATLDWPSSSGVAESGSDYVAASGTLTFAPGETTKNVPIEVLGDTLHEPPLIDGEWGLVQLSNPVNATISTGGYFGLGVFIIVDDDPGPP